MSIIGNGDIASILPDREGFIFFASGVSNSQEERESEYQREINLLLEQDSSKHLVYFGSLSIFYAKNRYSDHKKEMELLIKKNFPNYTIIRLGNITWGTNPHTIINFFRNKIKNGEPIVVKDAHRYVVEKDEFLHWIGMIPEWNCEMNITGQYMTTLEIIHKYGHN